MINFKLLRSKNNSKFNLEDVERIRKFSIEEGYDFRNLLREYLVVLSLEIFSSYKESEHLILKGGSALSLFYGSGRLSSDLDIDLYLNLTIDSVKYMKEVFEMFKNIELKGTQNKKGFEYHFSIGKFKENKTIQKYKGKFSFYNKDFNINEYVEIDLSFQNEGIGIKTKITEKKRNLYGLRDDLYFNCLKKEDILVQKIITFGDRYKFNDIYDINFLLRNGCSIDIEKIKDQAISDYRENTSHSFYGLNDLEDIEKAFLGRIENIFKEESIDLFGKESNKILGNADRIEDITKFLEDFYDLIKSEFDILKGDEFEIGFDEIDFSSKEITENKLRVFLNGWNLQSVRSNKKQPEIKLSDCLIIRIENDKYDVYKNNSLFKTLKIKDHLIEFLMKNEKDSINNDFLNYNQN